MKIKSLIEKLAAFEPNGEKVISIYLDAQAGQNGRDDYQAWLKTQFFEYSVQFDYNEDKMKLYEATKERIDTFLASEAETAANGIAIFAGVGENAFFETVQLDEPFAQNVFEVGARPHLFPLVHLDEHNQPYVVLWADTNKAEFYIFGGEADLDAGSGADAKVEEIQNEKTNRTQVGGWSQARFQRHVENFHLQHAKETVAELEKLLRERRIERLVLCGDETSVMPVLRPQLSKETEEKVIAVLNMSQYASEAEIREKTRAAIGVENAVRDKESVERVYDAARAAAGMGTLGVEKTLAALSNGQVQELVIASDFNQIRYNPKEVEKVLEDYAPGDDNSTSDELPTASDKEQIGDELLIRALNSDAKITFIEDASMLGEANGVGAILRYSIHATAG